MQDKKQYEMRKKKEKKIKQEQEVFGLGGNDDFKANEEEPNVAYKFTLFYLFIKLNVKL